MRMRFAAGLAVLTAALIATAGPAGRAAQKDKGDKGGSAAEPAAPKFLYAHDVKVRPAGERDFYKAKKLGVEVYEDEATKAVVAVSEVGALAVIPAGPVGEPRTCKWVTGLDMKVRPPEEPEFTDKSKKYGVEMYRDLGSKRLLYVSETGSIAFAPEPPGLVTDLGPKWHHGLVQKVRAPEQRSFENAPKFGVEVFKDQNTGGLVYVSEPGAIATAPAPAAPRDTSKPPVRTKDEYGLVLRVRGGKESDFTEKTKRIGLEVSSDPNADNVLLFLSQSGSVATAPNPGKFSDKGGVTWRRGMALMARKGGEKSFDAATKYGIEVFEDNRTGHLIFISETGSIAVLPKAK